VIEAGSQPYPGYRLTRRLGRGAFGEVWEGANANGERLAFKFIPTKGQSPSQAANEVRMLLALRQLRHPNLVALKDVVVNPNYLILMMEQADGNLYHLLAAYHAETGTHIPPDHLCELMEQAAAGLDYLASRTPLRTTCWNTGLQHCDVKPSNLLLFGDQLKVADFGLCAPQVNLRNNKAFGTPGYMPRELCEGKVTPRTDQYSLAMTYAELRLGSLPCAPKSLRNHSRPDLAWFPGPERSVLVRAADDQWLNRYPSCGEFVAALREAVKHGSTPRRLSGSHPRLMPA
jgi:serine/threonine protein kinase